MFFSQAEAQDLQHLPPVQQLNSTKSKHPSVLTTNHLSDAHDVDPAPLMMLMMINNTNNTLSIPNHYSITFSASPHHTYSLNTFSFDR